MKLAIPFLGCLLLLASCSSGTGPSLCPAEEGRFAVQGTVVDAVTKAPILGIPIGTVTAGTFVDSVQALGADPEHQNAFAAAWNRPGVYTLTLAYPGYQQFTRGDLVARAGPCGVEAAFVAVELAPE